METTESEVLVKLVSQDREALEGLTAFLKQNLQHCFPSSIMRNDRDGGYHCFLNVVWDGSTAEPARGPGK